MATTPSNAYDAFRYPGRFYPQATPDRMATLAILFGLETPRVDNCRILELGCGEGANLITLAYALPNSRLFGVDLAESAIQSARANAREVGTSNVEFRALDLLEFPSDGAEFDYIIAHGLFSWVPPAVREKILDICAHRLSPNGLAYISYNALPGSHFRSYPRDIMRFHTRGIDDPARQVSEARAAVQFILSALADNTAEAAVLSGELESCAGYDSIVYHDLLADNNQAYYFTDFLDAAAAVGLQYVAEADTKQLLPPPLPDAVRAQLDEIEDRVTREQYVDFIQCRRFRQTILCRAGQQPTLEFSPDRLRSLLISGGTRPAAPISDLHDPANVEFRVPTGSAVTCSEAVPKALFCVLGEAWPNSFQFDDLLGAVLERVGEPLDSETEAKFAAAIGRCYLGGLLHLRSFAPRLCPAPSAQPVASAVARFWAKSDVHIPSLTLAVWEIKEDALRALLLLLNGGRDRQQLAAELSARLGQPVSVPQLEQALLRLAEFGMLLA